MPISPVNLARVSNLQRTRQIGSSIAGTQADLLKTQNELATGRRLINPSDDPADATLAQQVRKTLERRQAYAANLDRSVSHLSQVDSSLGNLTDLLRQAQQIASANVGSDASGDQRAGAAQVVQSIYRQAVGLANGQHEGQYLFAGDRLTDPPFVQDNGGLRYVGGSEVLSNAVGDGATLQFQVDGRQVFGAVSAGVTGAADLTPAATADTRLSDLRGATGGGVKPGVVRLSSGGAVATVDLSGADTLGGVADLLNAAGVGATVSVTAAGLRIDGAAVSLTDVGGGTTAKTLGLTAGGGAAVVGDPVRPNLTPLTRLADLRGGAGLDPAGLTITNGTKTQTINPAALTTVEDFLNAINGGPTGARAEINEAGTGLNIQNPVQAGALTISENGGTTAADLGLRSFSPATALADLNGGRGVRLADGADLRLTDSAGATADVDLSGAGTVQDVIDRINAAGTGLTAGFAATGNGITLADAAGGAAAPAIAPLGGSAAAQDLGLVAPPAGGASAGADVNPVRADGLFGHLAALRDALQSDDQNAITAASEGLDADLTRVVNARGAAGARAQEFESRQSALEDQNLASKTVLSELEDADFAETTLKFQTLQTSLQATLRSSSQILSQSLMDFLN